MATYGFIKEQLEWLGPELPRLLMQAGRVTIGRSNPSYIEFRLVLNRPLVVRPPRTRGCLMVNPATMAIFCGTYLGFDLRDELKHGVTTLNMGVMPYIQISHAEGERLRACENSPDWELVRVSVTGTDKVVMFARQTDAHLRNRIKKFAGEIASKSWCYVIEP